MIHKERHAVEALVLREAQLVVSRLDSRLFSP
jgi:hypothetical protein